MQSITGRTRSNKVENDAIHDVLATFQANLYVPSLAMMLGPGCEESHPASLHGEYAHMRGFLPESLRDFSLSGT